MKAELDLCVSVSEGRTYLKHQYFTPPFKIANVTAGKHAACLELMIMSASPGILDGDEYCIDIAVESQAQLHLQTQAYQRLYQMKTGATQHLDVTLDTGASFTFLPHPSVPHESSSFTSVNNFFLADACHFVFGEILTCGRKLNGESFLMQQYHSKTSIYLHQKLIIRENLLMQPSQIDVAALGQLEGYSHQASLIILNEKLPVKLLKEQITSLLTEVPHISYGVTVAPVNGVLVRLLGNGGEQLHKLLKKINLLSQRLLITSRQEDGSEIN